MSIISKSACQSSVILSPFDKLRVNSVEGSRKDFAWILRPYRAQNDILVGLLLVLSLLFCACDFHGPWDYYPEDRDVYAGIYTYGIIAAEDTSYVCFSKVYELDETASKDFAFYDSAFVVVENHTYIPDEDGNPYTDTLAPLKGNPNCFSREGFHGHEEHEYRMVAYFEWDSAGHRAKSTFEATATIPPAVKVTGINAPQQDGSYKWIENKDDSFEIDFIEFPFDMEFIKIALDYDKSVAGVLTILDYDYENGESMNTTINGMLGGLTETDDQGYTGISMHDPLESQVVMGYQVNTITAGMHSLDTLYGTNMMLTLGKNTVVFYATDEAYVDYNDKVLASQSDSRVVPESNIKNGMGVFSGVSKSSIALKVNGDGVDFSHIAEVNCANTKGDFADSWDFRGCRLFQDVFCAGIDKDDEEDWDGDWRRANSEAYTYYRRGLYHRRTSDTSKTCFASFVKAAMMLDTTKWSEFLPNNISKEDKDEAYADGLKRYCIASNFKNNSIADCGTLKEQCLESPEKNSCKEYLWMWCADRKWDMDYEQCRAGLVSRYYLEEQKSSILEREVKAICKRDNFSLCQK